MPRCLFSNCQRRRDPPASTCRPCRSWNANMASLPRTTTLLLSGQSQTAGIASIWNTVRRGQGVNAARWLMPPLH